MTINDILEMLKDEESIIDVYRESEKVFRIDGLKFTFEDTEEGRDYYEVEVENNGKVLLDSDSYFDLYGEVLNRYINKETCNDNQNY